MTDNEIIKALEHCTAGGKGCNGCPLNDMPMDCIKSLVGYALDLIKRQQAEIERLKEREENISIICKRAEEKHHQLYEEAKQILVRQTKLEAIGEFAERLKSEAVEAISCCTFSAVVCVADIDNILVEMVGGNNGA